MTLKHYFFFIGKLLFPLCARCADSRHQDDCHHAERDRALTGTWTSVELHYALDHGYQVLELYEVWHYPEMLQHNPSTASRGIFEDYVNLFLKLKQEASGWPSDCVTDEAKAAYIKEYQVKEGVALDPNSVAKNPGLRTVAKLCLNSNWGKFGQRGNLPRTMYTQDPADMYAKLNDPSVEVHNILGVDEETVQIDWVDGFPTDPPFSNLPIACFTTANARIKLHREMHKLGHSVLYTDTDSIFYMTDGYIPPTAPYLGSFLDEVKAKHGPEAYISEFVATAPKSYSYRVVDRNTNEVLETVCKVKGFTLNFRAQKIINFESVLRTLTGGDPLAVVQPNQIRRKGMGEIVSVTETKRFRFCYDKRRIMDGWRTVPFGFRA